MTARSGRMAQNSGRQHGAFSLIGFPDVSLDQVKGVLIDIDNTLYAYEPAHQIALNKAFCLWRERAIANMSREEFGLRYRACRDQVTSRLRPQGACRSRFLAFQLMLEAAGQRPAYLLAAKLEETYWSALIDNATLDGAAHRMLLACRQAGLPVCAVTDMQATIQVRKLKALGVSDLIDYMVTSEEVGEEKPAKAMFECALRKLGLSAKDVVMVGDDEKKDIEGATCLGIKAYKVC